MPRPLIPTLALALLAAALVAPPAAAADISACAAASYHPADQPPFGGEPVPPLRPVRGFDRVPSGFRLSAREAITIAEGTEAVRTEASAAASVSEPALVAHAFTEGSCRWRVSFFDSGDTEVARVEIDDRTGTVLESWSGSQVGTELARGYAGAVAQKVNAPYVWIPLCILFVAPFFDPRRPFRLLHLDLLAVLGLSASLFFFNRADVAASVALTYPTLVYVFARGLWIGFRPRERTGSLIPSVSIRVLAIAAVALAAGRIALNVADSHVIDVGVAGVAGADRITHGEPLYEGEFSPGLDLRGDVYGPANYLAYVPFELVFGWDGEWGDVPAAHAAAIAFDLLAALGLVALGTRLRRGREGKALGVALGFAWMACPWTLYAMNANANDALVAASVIWALVALASPPGRALWLALGAAAKFGTVALAPLFATAGGWRDRRGIVIFSAVFAGVLALLFIPFIPDGGVSELYDRTLGYQADRSSPFSVWGQAPSLNALQDLARVGAIGLAVALAFIPRSRTAIQLAALSAAVIVAVQAGATHWFYFYVVWFLPVFLVAAFGELQTVSRSSSAAPRAAAS
jgi:Glycosyltransferase family 87